MQRREPCFILLAISFLIPALAAIGSELRELSIKSFLLVRSKPLWDGRLGAVLFTVTLQRRIEASVTRSSLGRIANLAEKYAASRRRTFVQPFDDDGGGGELVHVTPCQTFRQESEATPRKFNLNSYRPSTRRKERLCVNI